MKRYETMNNEMMKDKRTGDLVEKKEKKNDDENGIDFDGSDPAVVESVPTTAWAPTKHYNHWAEDQDNFIYWKVKPTKGFVQLKPADCMACTGERRTHASFGGEMQDCFEDWCFVDTSDCEDASDRARRHRIRTTPWTGPTFFPK